MSKTKFYKSQVVNTFRGEGVIEAIDHQKNGTIRDRAYVIRLNRNNTLVALTECEVSS